MSCADIVALAARDAVHLVCEKIYKINEYVFNLYFFCLHEIKCLTLHETQENILFYIFFDVIIVRWPRLRCPIG